jgi:UDP-N-acetylmuramate dehydrogenase
MELRQNTSLKDYTTLGIGGSALYFIEVSSLDQMKKAIYFSKEKNLPYLVLGKGSNTLFNDRGYLGVVILNKITTIEWNNNSVTAGAGYSFSLLGVQSAKKALSGLEFASGIPASVGGAVFMNAGANGQETFDSLVSVGFLNDSLEYKELKKEEIQYGYRYSSFQENKGAIVSATFCLKEEERARTRQLEIIEYRINTQPYDKKSAGCVFRNPSEKSAGALIDSLGLKGVEVGGACVSDKHANFLINNNQATAEDFLALINKIKQQVHQRVGVELEVEIRQIPFEG